MPEIGITLPKFKPKQQLVWESKATEILLAGDTRGGKSFCLRKIYILLASQIPGLLLDIFRLNYDDVIKGYMDGETSFPALLYEWEKEKLVTITENEISFWNGSTIYLEHCFDDKVMRKHQGNARHVRAIDESAQIPENRIRSLTGWVTMSAEMLSRVPKKWEGTFPRMYHLTNFMGPGMGYYRRGFLEPREPYKIETVGQFQRQYIPFYLTDNDSEDAARTIARIREAFPDPMVQRALLECDWRAMAGDFYPEWSPTRHVVEDFYPPAHFFRFRTLDLGYAEPCCTLWIAVSDGEPFKDGQGRERWFPRGAFIVYQEWYICDPNDPSKGQRYRNEDIRDGIMARSELGKERVPTLTDSLPFQDRGGESVTHVFAKNNGIVLTLGDTSRVNGWNQLRSRLIGQSHGVDNNGIEVKIPMVYVCERCTYLIQYIPMLQRHPSEKKPEDAQEHGEATHSTDALRIACTAHTIIKDHIAPLASRIDRAVVAAKPSGRSIATAGGLTLAR